MNRIYLILCMSMLLTAHSCVQAQHKKPIANAASTDKSFVDEKGDTIFKITRSNEEWKSMLDQKSYNVLREKGTEMAFTGPYNANKKRGLYNCKACGLSLFSSNAKFDSGTGWPSFYEPIDKTHVLEETDNAHGMRRVEVLCNRCGGHLGHVFDDGPAPTGLRYCMNSAALDFKEQ